MTQQRYMTVQFGPAHAGCATVGYTLQDAAGASVGDRVGSAVVELVPGSGVFGALVMLPEGFTGSIAWDTGGSQSVFAVEEINLTGVAAADMSQDPRIMSGGNGPVLWQYQLLNQSGQPIVRADVFASTDLAGRRVVAFAQTDAAGLARLRLEPGPVYLWRSRPGCVFTNPDSQTVEVS